jgi:hypothetical protein
VTLIRRRAVAAAALGLLLLRAEAGAHVAPSLDDNNRYLKLSLLGDRVRLAYTVFFGEVPGLAMRRTIDTDRDGQLSDAETDGFARRLADEVAGQLAVQLDGRDAAVTFSLVSFGSVTAAVAGSGGGGAFSVDLVATLCLQASGEGRSEASGEGRSEASGEASGELVHRLTLRDRFHVPRPGETEVHLEDGPGISIGHAAIGEHRAAERGFRFAGHVPALSEPGLQVEFRVAAGTVIPRAGACEAQAKARGALRQGAGREAGRGTRGKWLALGGALAALGVALGLRARRRARRSGSKRATAPKVGAGSDEV